MHVIIWTFSVTITIMKMYNEMVYTHYVLLTMVKLILKNALHVSYEIKVARFNHSFSTWVVSTEDNRNSQRIRSVYMYTRLVSTDKGASDGYNLEHVVMRGPEAVNNRRRHPHHRQQGRHPAFWLAPYQSGRYVLVYR